MGRNYELSRFPELSGALPESFCPMSFVVIGGAFVGAVVMAFAVDIVKVPVFQRLGIV
jgi:hypothetical protein